MFRQRAMGLLDFGRYRIEGVGEKKAHALEPWDEFAPTTFRP